VTVAAHDRHAGQHDAVLGGDDMDDALLGIVNIEQMEPELATIHLHRADAFARRRVSLRRAARQRRGVVVDHAEGELEIAHALPALAQAVERIAAGALVDEMTIDVDQPALAECAYDMRVPDFLEQGCARHS
jgi:hypothetical protein